MSDKNKVSQAINAGHNTLDVNDDKLEQVDITPKTKTKAKAKRAQAITCDSRFQCSVSIHTRIASGLLYRTRPALPDFSRLSCIKPQSDFHIPAKETASVPVNGIQGALASKNIRCDTCFALR